MKPRKSIFLSSATTAILLLAFIFNAYALDIDAKAVNSKVDKYMSELVKQKRFSGSVLISKDRKPIVERSYGMANIAEKIPNTLQTKFRIGPITDQLKAAAIMKLQEQGKLNLSDRISEYLDDCPDALKSILILHLLNQCSGIPDYMKFPNFVEIGSQKLTPATIVSLFKDKALEFSPGARNQFSTSNYLLIGLIIEKVSGMSYIDFMQKTIFKPLGMKNTGFAGYGEIIEGQVSGYELKENEFTKAVLQDIFPYSVSSIYSTVEDLLIWDQSLYSEKFLSRQSLNIMFPSSARNYYVNYVNGSIIDYFDRKMIFIAGGILGFSSYLAVFPEEKVCIIILSNLDFKSCPIEQTNLNLSAIIFGDDYEPPKEHKVVKVDPAIYDKYAGEYQFGIPVSGQSVIVTITREADKLIAEATGQIKFKFEVFPVSETNFIGVFTYLLNEQEAELEFIKDAAGHVTLLVVRQAGHEIPFRKLHNKKLSKYKAEARNIDYDNNLKSHGFDPRDISNLIGLIEKGTYPNIHSLIIMRGGDIVLEKYFNGYNAWDAHPLMSASKSFTSALIGIALEKGCLKSLDQKILSFFPQYKTIENLNGWKKMIDIEDILTMRSGVDHYGKGPGIDSPDARLNSLIAGWERFYLNRPMATKPGTSFNYEGGGPMLLTSILKSACGMHADVLADKWLFLKLGITGAYWIKNWEKHPHTGIGLYMKPLDMAKFGLLYLRKGMWNSEQVIPASWIDESFKMHVDFHGKKHPYTGDYGIGYSYLWWIYKPAKEGRDSQYIYTVNGGMGQRIFVIPEYDMVVVVTAWATSIEESMNGEKILYEHIIPAIRK
jgi:CubicO group peptidase (beta-lactamase class C family)